MILLILSRVRMSGRERRGGNYGNIDSVFVGIALF